MTNQTPGHQFPTDKVRAILNNRFMRDDEKIAEIKAMLPAPAPAPSLPTLADKDEEERAASQWMRADVPGTGTRYVIADPRDDDNDAAILISEEGKIEWVFPEYVVPRPDLPRMPWTDTEKPAPALPEDWRIAEHQTRGRVIVTRPEPDGDGDVAIICSRPDWGVRAEMIFCKPAELTYIDAEADQ